VKKIERSSSLLLDFLRSGTGKFDYLKCVFKQMASRETIIRVAAALKKALGESDEDFHKIYWRVIKEERGGWMFSSLNFSCLHDYLLAQDEHEILSRLFTIWNRPKKPWCVGPDSAMNTIIKAVERGDEKLLEQMEGRITFVTCSHDPARFKFICKRPRVVKAFITLLDPSIQKDFGNRLIDYMHRNGKARIGEILAFNLFELDPCLKERLSE
jgi:hypothetical protein